MANSKITIPYSYKPYPYQVDLFRARDNGYKRFFTVWHRRAGKDKSFFNFLIREALKRKGIYHYYFPEFAQAKRVIWDGMDKTGFRFIDHIPKPLLAKPPNTTELKIELCNGSVIQLLGTDKFDKVRGSNPVGCVFSEYAFQNPKVFEVIRPILRENGGWAAFNTTPFGKNHAYELFRSAQEDPETWFTQLLTIDDTTDWGGNRILLPEDIEEERKSGMSEDMIQQEFYCSWTANAQGFYFLSYIEDARNENRITTVPYDPTRKVDTWWDIGFSDTTAIWFTQTVGKAFHIIDFYQNNSKGLEFYAKYLQKLPYVYGSINFPHDIKKTEFGTGRSALEQAEELFAGIELNHIPKLDFEDGVNAARAVLPLVYFDKEKCKDGLRALENYHREWDDYRKEFKQKPAHNWSSHPSDAFRYFATGVQIPEERSIKEYYMRRFRSTRGFNRKDWRLA